MQVHISPNCGRSVVQDLAGISNESDQRNVRLSITVIYLLLFKIIFKAACFQESDG